MRRLTTTFSALAAAAAVAALGLAAAAPAQAATGQVVVFSTEIQPLDVYTDPTGCHRLPITSHVIDNLTDQPIHVFLDPFCTVPAPIPVLAPNYGSHVSNVGSFSA
jgi:hypothetical protein